MQYQIFALENPSIYLLGVRIDEPVTMLTDVLVALVCWHAWWQLQRSKSSVAELPFFRLFFLLMGIATFIGGVIGHGFLYALSFEWKLPGWLISMLSITVLERGVIFHTRPLLKEGTVRFFYWFNIIELLIFASLAFTLLEFKFVELHSAYGLMVVVFSFCLYNYWRGSHTRFIQNMITGVVLSMIAAVIFIGRFGISQWFTHADISHLLMAATAVFFYRGARSLQEG